jgi:hypothetical protein
LIDFASPIMGEERRRRIPEIREFRVPDFGEWHLTTIGETTGQEIAPPAVNADAHLA